MPRIAATAAPQEMPDTLDGLAERIGQAFARLDRGAQECNLARLEAARLLVQARRQVLAAREADPAQPGFERWCALHVRRSWRDVQRLVRIGEAASPRAALERERAVNRAAQQATRRRAPRAAPQASAAPSNADDAMVAPPAQAGSFVAPAEDRATCQSSDLDPDTVATIVEEVRRLSPRVRRIILRILTHTSDAEQRLICQMLEGSYDDYAGSATRRWAPVRVP